MGENSDYGFEFKVLTEGTCSISKFILKNSSFYGIVRIPALDGNARDVVSIEPRAFYGASHITAIIVPSEIKSIGEKAFLGCTKLVQVYNDSKLTFIKGEGSNGFIAHYAIRVENGSTGSYQDRVRRDNNGYFFYKGEDGTNYLIGCDDGISGAANLPKFFEEEPYRIHRYAFYKNKNFSTINIPSTISYIDSCAFLECNMSEVSFGEEEKETINTSSFGNDVFRDCKQLKTFKIKKGITTTGNGTFYGCSSLQYITLPETVHTIGNSAFY